MRAELRAKRHLEKLKATGAEFSPEEEELILARFMQERAEKVIVANTASREAESVLALIARQDLFTAKFCKECSGPFATNFADVAYCSDECRKSALEKRGIEWNPLKHPEDRWGYNGPRYHDDEGKEHNVPFPAPLVVPPEALKVLTANSAVRQFFAEVFLEVKPESEAPQEPKPEPKPEPQVDRGQALLDALGG